MGTERKEPAPERGERGQPALRNVSRRLLFRPVTGLDEMTTSSQCWRTGLVSAAPVGAQYRHFRGPERSRNQTTGELNRGDGMRRPVSLAGCDKLPVETHSKVQRRPT